MSISLIASALIAAQPLTTAQPATIDHSFNQREIELAEDRGRRIYAYDRVALAGLERALNDIDDGTAVVGYVVTETDQGPVLTLIADAEGGIAAAWRGLFIDGKMKRLPFGSHNRPALSDQEKWLSKRKRAALDYIFDADHGVDLYSCAGDTRPNVVVLRPTESDPHTLDYILTPQPGGRLFEPGGNFRVEFDAKLNPERLRPLSGELGIPKSPTRCLQQTFNMDGRESIPIVRHENGAIPTEIHVYTSLLADGQ